MTFVYTRWRMTCCLSPGDGDCTCAFVWSGATDANSNGIRTRPVRMSTSMASRLTTPQVALRQPRLEYDSPRSDEHSILAVCPHSNRIISVVLHNARRDVPHHICETGETIYEQREYRILHRSRKFVSGSRAATPAPTGRASIAMTDEEIEAQMRDDPDWARVHGCGLVEGHPCPSRSPRTPFPSASNSDGAGLLQGAGQGLPDAYQRRAFVTTWTK